MDAERLVSDALNAAKLGAACYTDVPEKRPATFMVAEQVGGTSGELVIKSPVVNVACWAGTRRNAALLADEVDRVALSLPDTEPNVTDAEITTRYRDDDIDTGTPRYIVGIRITAQI